VGVFYFEVEMNLIKIKSLTINLDRVAYWKAVPKSRRGFQPKPHVTDQGQIKPFEPLYDEEDGMLVTIYFSEGIPPLDLDPDASKLFLDGMRKEATAGPARADELSASSGS
jgi:hypothetical protein